MGNNTNNTGLVPNTKMDPVAYVGVDVLPEDMSFKSKIKAFSNPFSDSDCPIGAVNPDLDSEHNINGSNLVDYVLMELETKHSLYRDYMESGYLGYGDLESFEDNTLKMAEAILNQYPDFNKLDVVELIAQTYNVFAEHQGYKLISDL